MTFPFTCPHCGDTSDLRDESAGRSFSCRSCGMVVSPQGDFASMHVGPEVVVTPAKSTILGMPMPVFVIVLILTVLLVCGGGLMALMFPAIQAVRTAARKNTSKNNLKNLGTAIHN